MNTITHKASCQTIYKRKRLYNIQIKYAIVAHLKRTLNFEIVHCYMWQHSIFASIMWIIILMPSLQALAEAKSVSVPDIISTRARKQ